MKTYSQSSPVITIFPPIGGIEGGCGTVMRGALFLILYIICAATSLGQTRYAEHSLLSSGKWVKVRVASEGVYQLTKADLTKMGFSNPDKVRLYGYNVPMLPEVGIEHFDDDLTEMPTLRKSDGTILFYSFGTTQWTLKRNTLTGQSYFTHKNNPYSSFIYYFLTEDASSAPLALETNTAESASLTMTAFPAHALVEKDEYSFLNAGRQFFESYNFADGSVRNYTVPMPDIASDEVRLDIQFAAASKTGATLTVSSASNTLATLYFEKLYGAAFEYEYADVESETVTWRNVVSENPVLKFNMPCPTGASGHLDFIRTTYERKLNIGKEGYLAFCTEKQSSYSATLTGANESTRVLRVTTPFCTQEQRGQYANGGYTAIVTPSEQGNDTYVAINTNATFPTPEVVGNTPHQDLHSLADIDYVIITPANGKLNAAAQRLADAHTEKEGMMCVVVQADQIYNEFSSGTPDATAYRRFLKMLYDKSEGRGPRNVLLFGPCVWDNRLLTSSLKGQKQDDYLLCYESENSVSDTDSYMSDEYITLLADGKGKSPLKECPDCGIGRLPVGNATEANTVVGKLIRYINGTDYGAWLNTICIMADDGNANLHGNDAEEVWSATSSLYRDYRYKKIYWDAYDAVKSATGTSFPDVEAEINKMVNEGALIMNYTGHGAAYCLSPEKVLQTADFQNWTSPRLPLWITAACDVMPVDMNKTNIGIEAVMNPVGGAMGFVGTARTVYANQNRTFNKHFMRRVLGTKSNGERYTIGEAMSAAKSDIINGKSYFSKNDSINKAQFLFVGDPAITLPTAREKVKIDKINGIASQNSQNSLTISAGEFVVIEGHVADSNGNVDESFNGLISPTMLDCVESIVCKDNDGSVAAVGGSTKPLEFNDRRRVLFNGTDSIRSGRFTVKFPIPLDISYANASGLITLFAINENKDLYANGSYSNFIIGGTASEALNDTVGPVIAAYLDSPMFTSGGKTSETPTLYAMLRDDSGINTSGAGLGHDITAIIDNSEATTYSLNNYFNQSIGDYLSGTVTFTFPALPAGKHTLTLRAFDTFNNMSELTFAFEVVEGLTNSVEYFDITGRQVPSDNAASLPKGVYIRRIQQVSPAGVVGEKAEKILVTQ